MTKVEFIFSKSDLIGSRLIRSLTKNLANTPQCSHIALLIDDYYIIEAAAFYGVRVMPFKKWAEINRVVARIQYKKINKNSLDIIHSFYGKNYDYLGVLYFGWRIILNKLFNKTIPKVNRLHSRSKFFCSELFEKITGEKYEMTSPNMILEKLLNDRKYKIK